MDPINKNSVQIQRADCDSIKRVLNISGAVNWRVYGDANVFFTHELFQQAHWDRPRRARSLTLIISGARLLTWASAVVSHNSATAGREGLGGRHADFRAGLDQYSPVGFPYQ